MGGEPTHIVKSILWDRSHDPCNSRVNESTLMRVLIEVFR